MSEFLDVVLNRRSIRKFKDIEIPYEDIEYFVKAAVNAPSGCNSQCWNFVAIKNKGIMNEIKEAVIRKNEEILKIDIENITPRYQLSKKKAAGFFANAPLIIAVFMTKLNYYDQIFISALKKHGYNDKGIMELYSNYDLLSMGAAIQNLLLAVHEKGYGACWMNEPAIIGTEINKILNIPLDQKFISLIPIGVPAQRPSTKIMKNFNKVFSIIE